VYVVYVSANKYRDQTVCTELFTNITYI